MGTLARIRRQFTQAERWYRQSLAIKERIGDEHGQAGTLHQLGVIAEERGNIAEVEALYAHLNDPHNLSIVRDSLKRVRRGRGTG